MKPEQRVAARVVQKYSLSVPIDVEGLAAQLADVEEDSLPVRSDAVVITSDSARSRPLIVLNRASPNTRRRFTLAHEVGHLLIPWHMGTFACHTAGRVRLGDDLYAATEAESNRFASELLLPSSWLSGIATSSMSAGQMLRFVRASARVSTMAATLALIQALPPGYLFAIVNELGFVDLAEASLGTIVATPRQGAFLDASSYCERCKLHEIVDASGGQSVHWWRYGDAKVPVASDDMRTASEILGAMISATVYNDEQARFFTQSINGIIGSANSSRKPKTAEELLGVLHETFTIRPELSAIMSHPDFEMFLAKRTVEIISRKRK